jgi:glutathione S-transferase
MALPVLWHFPISHFNEKVRWALDFKSIPHIRRVLSIDYVPRAWWATGQVKLPILFLDGAAIADSTRIIERLEAYKPDPPLYPADAAARIRALALEDFFDEGLGPALRGVIIGEMFLEEPHAALRTLSRGMPAAAYRVMAAASPAFRAFYRWRHDISPATIESGKAAVLAALDRIEHERQPSGYLVGDRFTIADLTAAALLSPLTAPPEFPYPPAGATPRTLARYRDALASRPAFQWALDMYRRHRPASAEVQ